jgi:two-component system chemotaxis response regulator CheB/chemosensory pili system protein ChpB (putative protein-glutamate methylesterase)
MTDTGPAVALLFDDTELGGQLREALRDRGARIVHEGGVSSLSRNLLREVGADVLVVNLDDSADDALDQLYEAIDGDQPRVVFNDAQASRALAGWDRARWARHLAVKVLAVGDIDPPRPQDARGLGTPVADPGEPAGSVPAEAANEVVEAASGEVAFAMAAPAESFTEDSSFTSNDDDRQREQKTTAESENLAAELEALLASGEMPVDGEDESGPGLRHINDEDLPPLHDGNFGVQPETDAIGQPAADMVAPAAPAVEELQLLDETDPSPASVTTPIPASAPVTPIAAPSGWALLDDEGPAVESTLTGTEKLDAAAFGIEKLSAADFLAPDVEQVGFGVEPTMSLELVSIEEAIAPQAYVHENEMLLDDLGSALSRVVLLGAAANGTESVCDFLGGLPADTRCTLLLVQHLGTQSTAGMATRFAAHCAAHCTLPVRVAEHGSRARAGEVLVAPAGQEVRIRRDGAIELVANDAGAQSPSIDASFSAVANVFGRDALAIVFAGYSTDGVAGSQAIHDRGGQVWVESSSGEHFSDMVSGILAERLVSFSGTPSQLAAHLIEVFP